MTTPRKAITLKTKVAVLLTQARCGCGCGEKLGEAVVWDHTLAHALEGSDGPENIRCLRADCDKIVTNGTKATTAGSTKHTVAKVKRLRGKAGKCVVCDGVGGSYGTCVGSCYACNGTGRKKPERKRQSRKFQKPPPGYVHLPAGRKVGA